MTTLPVDDDAADITTGDAAFDGYNAAFQGGEAPLLGHLVLYSICESNVTPDDLERWFRELDLNLEFVPGRLRAEDAFERVTGPNGVRESYPLEDPMKLQERRWERRERGQKAQVMVRHVSRDEYEIVRHVVREVRDANEKRLDYDTHLAECRFRRDRSDQAERGDGQLEIVADEQAIAALPVDEQTVVRGMLFRIEEQHKIRCTYLSADKLRAVVRKYIESMKAIKVREGGGGYFVHRRHAGTLAALRALVLRFESKSQLTRIPLPDQEEMRELVVSAFTTKAKEDLDALARDIAAAQREGKGGGVVQALHQRFLALKKATEEHTELLSTSLGDTDASLRLVNVQLVSLLSTVGSE